MDLYSTHSEYLMSVFNIKGKLNNVIEFGMGNYSTKILIENSNRVTSIEMQSSEWYSKMVSEFSNKSNWKSYLMVGPYEFEKFNYDNYYDLAFIDGHGDSRPDCINLMMTLKCPIILSHDTEEPGYNWNRVNNTDEYKKIDFKKHKNWTTLWTNDSSFFEKIKNLE